MMKQYEINGQESGQGVSILALTRASDEAISVRVEIVGEGGQERHEFVLLEGFCRELSLAVGEIEAELVPELAYFAEVTKAYFAACASFAYIPSSLRALQKKLLIKGFARDVASDAIEELRRRGFVDESGIARRRAELMVEKHWGSTRILAKLHEEGFDESVLSETEDYLASVDFSSHCRILIEKKQTVPICGSSPEARHARDLLYASLLRMGYTASQIREAMKR